MAQVFISYSRRDLAFVEQLVTDLKKTGVDVWYDLSGLEGGSRWGVEIRKAIQNSDYVIVVLSPDSVESEWVEREYLFSNNEKKKTLPIMYRDCELPLGFLNVNYVDVRGENYARNFDKIARFLNMEPIAVSSTGTPATKYRATLARNPLLLPILGGIAALAVIGGFLLFNARGMNPAPVPTGTNSPAPAAIEPTASSVSAVSLVTQTSTAIEPTATVTELAPPVGAMNPSVPLEVEIDSQAVFLHTAAGANMWEHYTVLNDPHASDKKALVFAMPHFSGSTKIYNQHFLAVWYKGLQWAIVNQDIATMRHNSEFHVRIVSESDNAFVHTATTSNIKDSWTVIDHPLASDPEALVFVMPTWSLDGAQMRLKENHPIGVWYTGSQWAVINLDGAEMLEGTAFNIQILSQGANVFMHTATSLNIVQNWTIIDNSGVDMAADKLVFVTPRGAPDGTQVNNPRPIGVWHDGTQWTIYNQLKDNQSMPTEADAMPEGAEFNVLILDPK